jgi:hypothetical protein
VNENVPAQGLPYAPSTDAEIEEAFRLGAILAREIAKDAALLAVLDRVMRM